MAPATPSGFAAGRGQDGQGTQMQPNTGAARTRFHEGSSRTVVPVIEGAGARSGPGKYLE
ncbi:MAG: hypothetical protein MZV70_35120 [Desulfobacterales bacterium]|nr:hypothetical protein [Desulfobacterales bacterium]